MEIQNFPSKVVKPIAKYCDYFEKAKHRMPERVVVSVDAYEKLLKAVPVAKALGQEFDSTEGFKYRGIPVVTH